MTTVSTIGHPTTSTSEDCALLRNDCQRGDGAVLDAVLHAMVPCGAVPPKSQESPKSPEALKNGHRMMVGTGCRKSPKSPELVPPGEQAHDGSQKPLLEIAEIRPASSKASETEGAGKKGKNAKKSVRASNTEVFERPTIRSKTVKKGKKSAGARPGCSARSRPLL